MNLQGYHLHMESFSGTTDANGDLSCTTAQTPLNDSAVVVHSNTSYITKVSSVSGTTTKIRFYTIQYDKASQTDKEVSNLPSGVSQATSKQNTGTGGMSGNASSSLPHSTGAHAHGVSFEYLHTHSVTNFTTTDATYVKANGIAVNAIIIYAGAD